MVDKILEILDKAGSLLGILIPTAVVIFYELRDKWKKAQGEVIKTNKEKALARYDVWEHEESKDVISQIKDTCNFYKDKGHADLVQYLQLENGTVATSKIQNMFMSCLAEDDRYGSIPKLIKHLQRLPYSETTCWLNKLTEITSEGNFLLKTPDISKADYNRTRMEGIKGIGSVMVAPVYGPDEILLGICVFYYHQVEYNGQEKQEIQFMNKFRASVESIILMYHTHRAAKKKELGLGDE